MNKGIVIRGINDEEFSRIKRPPLFLRHKVVAFHDFVKNFVNGPGLGRMVSGQKPVFKTHFFMVRKYRV